MAAVPLENLDKYTGVYTQYKKASPQNTACTENGTDFFWLLRLIGQGWSAATRVGLMLAVLS